MHPNREKALAIMLRGKVWERRPSTDLIFENALEHEGNQPSCSSFCKKSFDEAVSVTSFAG